jgi:ferritin-like metal-binding protein YciE
MIIYSESEAKEVVLGAYLTDLHAVEKYLLRAVEEQATLTELPRQPDMEALLKRLADTLTGQLQRLELEITVRGAESRASMKDTMTAVAGFAFGITGRFREASLSRHLRDDATVLTLLCLEYAMLHTTALSLDRTETAIRARDHLRELAPLVMEINWLLPLVVAHDLAATGFMVDSAAPLVARESIEEAWREGAD